MYRIICLTLLIFSSSKLVIAGKRNLINKEDLSPSLAISNKKLADGRHEFVIGKDKKLGKKPLTFEFLKKSLEEKLGTTFGVVVEGSVDRIIVTYEGSTDEFLRAVSRTRIKTKFRTSLAVSQISGDTGVRAQRKGHPDPGPNEVLASITALEENYIKVVIIKNGGKGKLSELGSLPLKIAPTDGKFDVGDKIYFQPVEKNSGIWSIKSLRLVK